ncbi:MAG: hypothetical protein IPJ38_04275 [Dechloromonas sp.]|uniref:Uncharacterized protein n=1 Tax=Candidatus Dechloromonas phosphorivorans TaxID=2899244 RepID=A0A935MSE1_9RHOO|nr:hypothetical protein [Candidatus Dechloromonas phosphorivorans]
MAEYFPGISVLAPGVTHVGNVRFIGCTLWTDYCLFGEQYLELAMVACAASLPDHKVITVEGNTPFSPTVARALHLQQREWLRRQLDEPFDGKTVVVTHHAPAPASLHPMFEKDLVSTAFISDLTDLLGSAHYISMVILIILSTTIFVAPGSSRTRWVIARVPKLLPRPMSFAEKTPTSTRNWWSKFNCIFNMICFKSVKFDSTHAPDQSKRYESPRR